MQVDLAVFFQVSLIILIIAIIVAVIQLIIILVDVRSVTRKFRQVVSAINVLEYLFDGDDFKSFIKKVRKAGFGWLEKIFKVLKSMLGGGKDG